MHSEVAFGTMYFAGVKLRFLGPIVIAGAALVTVFVVTSQNRMDRLLAVFDPNCDPSGQCYQPFHGLWGLAGGGILGRGLGNSHEKYNWLPAAADDYIFAIVGEELGLIGCVVVLLLFGLFAVGAFHIIRRTDDPFVRIVAGGITIWIVGQAMINVAVVLRVFPVLGVPLPGDLADLPVVRHVRYPISCVRWETTIVPRRAPARRGCGRLGGHE